MQLAYRSPILRAVLPGWDALSAADASSSPRSRSRLTDASTVNVPQVERSAGIGFLSSQAPLAYRQKSSHGLQVRSIALVSMPLRFAPCADRPATVKAMTSTVTRKR